MSDRFVRDRQANSASHPHHLLSWWQGALFTAPCLMSSIRAVDKFGFEGGGWQFSSARGACCCSPTSLSPAPVSALSIPHRSRRQPRCRALTPARQTPLPFWSYHVHAHTCVIASPFPRSLSVRDGLDVKPQTARGFSLSSYLISFASRAACEVGEALSSRRAVRPSHTPL